MVESGAPVGRHEPVADQPVVTDGHEDVSVAAIVVEADLGEDGEVAGDACLVRTYLGEADVRHVVAHDPFHAGCLRGRNWCRHGATEKLDDRGGSADRLASAQLELPVFAEALSELIESKRVARPVVAGECAPDAFTGHQLPNLHDWNRKPAMVPPWLPAIPVRS